MAITLEFSEQEIQNLVALLDAGVRQGGIRAAAPAALLMAKIEEASKPKEAPDVDG